MNNAEKAARGLALELYPDTANRASLNYSENLDVRLQARKQIEDVFAKAVQWLREQIEACRNLREGHGGHPVILLSDVIEIIEGES